MVRMASTERFRAALSAASRGFKAVAMRRMRTIGLHPGQNFLLEALRERGELTTGELARHMHVEVPTATRMIQRMEAAGFLSRKADPLDRRRVRVTLTTEGERAAEAVPVFLAEVTEKALDGFSPAERDQAVELLERVAANLDWPPEG
jgi:MarR family transcriptional regulator, organic hydroperoxide resistance regulator